jgi:hypothetical protein
MIPVSENSFHQGLRFTPKTTKLWIENFNLDYKTKEFMGMRPITSKTELGNTVSA